MMKREMMEASAEAASELAAAEEERAEEAERGSRWMVCRLAVAEGLVGGMMAGEWGDDVWER